MIEFSYNKLGRTPQEIIDQMRFDTNRPLNGFAVFKGKNQLNIRVYDELKNIPHFLTNNKIYNLETGELIKSELQSQLKGGTDETI